MRFTREAQKRMLERGAQENEVRMALHRGRPCPAKHDKKGKEMAFPFGQTWKGKLYLHKLVRAIYVEEDDEIVVITVIVKYGKWEDWSWR